MRPELNDIQIIEKFIFGELSEEKAKKVEEKINNDPEFAKKVEKQRLIVEANQNLGLKQTAKKSHSKFKLKKVLKFGIPGMAIIAAAVAGVMLVNVPVEFEEELNLTAMKYALNEEGTALWVDADEH
ncbi:MAG: hypothetical protein JKY54_05675, partial [Flavobacteriales bacterium]|nr:hypothetical protein [Flavobacteriales bacterium]